MTHYRRCDVSDSSRAAGHGPGSWNHYAPHTHRLLRRSRLDQRVTHHRTPLIRAVAILAVLIAAFAPSSTAGAATSCSKAILDDWLDNDRIDRIYDLPCYEAAIDALPEDILIYTNAEEVIGRAFQGVSGKRLPERQLQGPSGVESTPPDVVPAVDSSASTAFPLPILVLGAMSIVLFAAGGLGYVQRRRRQN